MYSLIYLSFGNSAKVQCELIYSLMSFNKIASSWSKENIQIIIYTDSEFAIPDLLFQCKISIRYVKKEKLEDWIKRSNGYIFIVKPRVLQDFLLSFDGNVLLIDTDTFFIQDPKYLFEKIEKGNLVMHLREHALTHRPLIIYFFELESAKFINYGSLRKIYECEMWNSGVIGLNSLYSPLVDDVIQLIEQISFEEGWPHAEWHIIEQLSFSCLFNDKQNIIPGEGFIIHYWFFKEFRYMLAKQLNYFHNSDYEEFWKIVEEHNINENYLLKTLAFDDIPILLMELMKKYMGIPQTYFKMLPEHTYIGNILRKVYFGQ